MRIRTQFIITILLFGIGMAAIIASVIITNHLVEKARQQEEIAARIVQGAGDLSYLANDYLIYRESQQLSRWQSRFTSFSNDVASLKTDTLEQQTLVLDIQANEQRLKEVFDSIVSGVEISSQNQNATGNLTFFQVSWSRLAVQSQVLAADASRLSQLLESQVDRLQKINMIFISALIGVFAAYFLVSYLIVQQRLFKSIDKLFAGTSFIGAGNLDYKLEEKRNDEISDLSRAFNRMTVNLKAMTASKSDLETEVAERQKAEEMLKQNEQRLREVVDLLEAVTKGTDVIMAVQDTEFRYIFFNEAYKEEIRRLTGKEITVGMGMEDLFADLPEQRQVAVTEWSQVLRGESTNKTIEFGESGKYRRIYNVLHTPVYDASGNVVGAGEIAYDVTELRKTEEELSRINRELRAITECNKVIVRAGDEQTLFKDVCRTMCDVVGYVMAWVGRVEDDKEKSVRPVAWAGREDGYLAKANITWADTKRGRGPTGTAARTGKTDFCQDFVTDTRAAPWRQAALARGFRSSLAVPLIDSDGNVHNVFTVYAAEPDGFTPAEVQLLEELAGDMAFGLSVLRSKIERQKVEEELRETRDYLDNLFNYANAPIIVWNPDFEITRFNHAFERLTGLSADEVLGKKLDILFPDDSRDVSMSHIRDTMTGQRWEVVEIPIQNVDGSVRIVLWNSATLFDVDGKTPVATIAQGQDITERKKTEQIKDEFIGLVSHELKTPITVVMGSVYTAMSRGISKKEARMLLQDAASSTEALANIIDNLLELSRAQSDRLMLRKENIDIIRTVRTIVEKLLDKSKLHRFVIDIPADLPPILADQVRIERILHNLIDNAIKYSPDGGDITIFGREEDDSLIVGVKDQGIGISQADQAKLFQPFERLEAASTVSGIGLGLNVCHRLVEAQAGRIWVESEPGKGATFFFSLPLA